VSAEVRKSPYTFTIHLTDWGFRVFGSHDELGDMSLLEIHEHNPPITEQQFGALWDLLDENIYSRASDAKRAVREWLKVAGPHDPTPTQWDAAATLALK
jgi:hypothetical protein